MKDYSSLHTQALENPMTSFTNDDFPCVDPICSSACHQIWRGLLRLGWIYTNYCISKPELIKEAMKKRMNFKRKSLAPLLISLSQGLPAKKEKNGPDIGGSSTYLPYGEDKALRDSCAEIINKWEVIIAETGSRELDVWHDLIKLTAYVISRAAFGSSYEEGQKIFELLKEQTDTSLLLLHSVYMPGLR
uniref:Uncharacterized protein n=1 Tax=Chenopodium quinoa TaxID=63459 RepID=A0A803L8R1_CHEQI